MGGDFLSSVREHVSDARSWADRTEAQARAGAERWRSDDRAILGAARVVGGAMISILLIAVVLNEVFSAVNVGSGPFSQIGTDLQTTGVAAVSLLVVGLIVVSANAIMGMFGGGGGMQ